MCLHIITNKTNSYLPETFFTTVLMRKTIQTVYTSVSTHNGHSVPRNSIEPKHVNLLSWKSLRWLNNPTTTQSIHERKSKIQHEERSAWTSHGAGIPFKPKSSLTSDFALLSEDETAHRPFVINLLYGYLFSLSLL